MARLMMVKDMTGRIDRNMVMMLGMIDLEFVD